MGNHSLQLWVRAQGSSDVYQAASSTLLFELRTPTSWVKSVLYGRFDEFVSIEGISVDSGGNTIVTSGFLGTATLGSFQLSYHDDHVPRSFVAKLNPNGNWLWAKQLDVRSYGVATDSQGNIYVAGYFSGTVTLGSTTLAASSTDVLVGKMDSNGNWLWAKKAGGSDVDISTKIILGTGSSLYITGRYKSSATFGSTTFSSSGGSDIFIAKLDTNGNWLWAKDAGSAGTDSSWEITTDSSGNVYIAGNLGATGSSFGTINPSFQGNYLAEINSSGVWQWVKSTGDTVRDIAIDTSANIYVAGQLKNHTSITLGSTTLTRVGTFDAFWAKADTNGNWVWASSIGASSENTEVLGLIVDSNNNVYTTGRFNQNITFGSTTLTANHPGSTYDIFVAKMNSSGTWLSAQKAGGTSGFDEQGRDVKFHNGKLYVAGIHYAPASFGSLALSSGAPGGFVWMFPAP